MQAESGCCYLHCISSLTVWGAAWARWMIPARRRSLSPVPALGQLPGDGAEAAAGLWGWFPCALQGSGDGSRVTGSYSSALRGLFPGSTGQVCLVLAIKLELKYSHASLRAGGQACAACGRGWMLLC